MLAACLTDALSEASWAILVHAIDSDTGIQHIVLYWFQKYRGAPS